jgi:hypothetical protein
MEQSRTRRETQQGRKADQPQAASSPAQVKRGGALPGSAPYGVAGPRQAAPVVQRGIGAAVMNWLGDVTNTRPDEEKKDAQEDLDEFVKKSFPTMLNYKPSSGTGMFDATFDPGARSLGIKMRILFKFVEGDPAAIGSPQGFRPSEYKWSEAEKQSWIQRYRTWMSARWGNQFEVSSTRKFWDDMKVKVAFDVVDQAEVVKTSMQSLASDPLGTIAALSAAIGNVHFVATVAKFPPDAVRFQTSSIARPGYHHDPANSGYLAQNAAGEQWGTAKLDSNDLRDEDKGSAAPDGTRTENLYSVTFTPFTLKPSTAGTTQLKAAKKDLGAKLASNGFANITGYSSTDLTPPSKTPPAVSEDERHIRNMDMARKRSSLIRTEMAATGASDDKLLLRNEGDAEGKPSTDPTACRVDVQVVQGATQMPAAHEMGHQVGADDEYTSAGAQSAQYQQMVKDATGDTIASGNNANIMSTGNQMKRHNYAPFVEVLKKITNMDQWAIR